MNTDYIRKLWFTSGAYIRESLSDYRLRVFLSTAPDLVFLRQQAD